MMMNNEQNAQVCDATKEEQSFVADYPKKQTHEIDRTADKKDTQSGCRTS